MPFITILFGALLVALGVAAYYVNGAAHPTALIPTWFGLGLILFGLLSAKRSIRMHAMHGAVLIALIGAIGALVAVLKPAHGAAAAAAPAASAPTGAASVFTAPNCKWAMFVLCVIFIVLCIRSFIAARVRRRQQAVSNAA